ncbi:hypothetical protein EDB81DRAFT_202425 [Dactylonectria macrodidyma]|uniref:RBR-type E3 ubiquitin transferase n=1 Tax=Dactylonectria macrodidyma TaxID=307937 RepID=A0A9P9DWX5_9HYPO|nr:hypothetical protein EDB81DRAFT_202425 [Dactylonectria macrodidyma]
MVSRTAIMPQKEEGPREEDIFSLEAIDQLGQTMRSRRVELETLLDTNEALQRDAFTRLAEMQALFKSREEEREIIENLNEFPARPSLEDRIGGLEEELRHERETRRQCQEECILLRNQIQAAKEELQQFKSAFCTDSTPRQILMKKILRRDHQAMDDAGENSNKFIKDLSSSALAFSLTTHRMDVKMTPEMCLRFSRVIEDSTVGSTLTDDVGFQTCHKCHKAKFFSTTRSSSLGLEFPLRSSPTSCCSKPLCSECFFTPIYLALTEEWCNVFESELQYKCPQPCCGALIKIESKWHLDSLLCGVKRALRRSAMEKYDNIISLRRAFQELVPQPGPMAFKSAIALHEQLVSRGKMNSFTFQKKTDRKKKKKKSVLKWTWLSENDHHESVQWCDVNQEGETTLRIPLFTELIQLSEKTKECSVCAESIRDLRFHSVDEWLEDWRGFHGLGMWKILKFPEKLGARCTHDIDVCSSCLQTYIQAQLQQRGRECCDNMRCPSFGCNRILEFDEIRLYADHETFEQYDKNLFLNLISKSPNFRWCLREQCPNGEIYENGPTSPCVTCTECNFRMCFGHQTPWHEGYTCVQIDNLASSKDVSSETRDWLEKNTKPCPGCNAPWERRGGCYHMTCPSCKHQFCWQCLADWKNIQPRYGTYRRTEHKEGCYFRSTDRQPTGITGDTLQDGINHIER